MTTLKKIDEAANNYNKTKDPKYKDQWYKLVKEFANGPHNIKRWSVSPHPCNEKDVRGNSVDRKN